MKYIFFLSLFLSLHLTLEARSSLQPDSTVKNDTISLKEVVVKAPALNTVMEVDGNVTIIKDTELSKLANPFEVMKFVPGLIVSDESVEVAGVGGAEIYIDRVKVKDRNELKSLSPDRIKSIKVIDSPGAKYGGDVRAVIIISTYRKPGEGAAVKEQLTLVYKDYFDPSNLLFLNVRSGNLDIFASLEYSHSVARRSNDVLTELFLSDGSMRSENQISSKTRSDMGYGKIGINFAPGTNHLLGAYYQGSLIINRNNILYGHFDNILKDETAVSADFDGSSLSRLPKHRINAFYAANWGKWKSDITLDMMFSKSKADQNDTYHYSDGNSSVYNGNSTRKNRLIAGKIDLSHPLFGGRIYIGSEVTNTNILSEFINQEQIIPSNTTRMNESNLGIYAEFSRKFGIVSVYGGIRYEYTRTKYLETVGGGLNIKKDYNEVIPSLSVRLPWRNVTLRLSYSKMYNKPIYAWLTNRIVYVNPNLYETGNMYLTPAYFNFYTLSCKYRWLMITLRYGHITGKVMSATKPYPDNQDVILDYKVNSPRPLRQYNAIVNLSPGFIGGIYYPTFTTIISPQYYSLEFRGEKMRFTNPIASINFNNLFKISDSFNALLNFNWSSPGDVEAGHHNGNWRLDLGVAKSFGTHWDIRLNIDDIFNSSRRLKATSYTSGSITEGEWIANRRSVRLTVSYQFNIRKSRYKETTAGEAELDRI